MSRRLRRKTKKRIFHREVAQPSFEGTPYTIVCIDPDQVQKAPAIQVFAYSRGEYLETEVTDPEALKPIIEKWPIVWVNIDSLDDSALVTKIGEIFSFHGLAMDDVLNVNQRAKVEDYEQYYYLVMRMAFLHDRLLTEQLSLFLGRNFVVTFQHVPGDCFQEVRQRIRDGKGKVRQEGADYLAYLLLDAIIDGYFPILEQFGEQFEVLEEESFASPSNSTLARIHEIKRDLLTLRRVVWPLREAVSMLLREPPGLIGDPTRVYLRDCYDHTVRVIDLLEMYRELGSDLSDIYLSSISLRLNEIMKVLTIFSSIFMPLTFIVGVYGMNFEPGSSPWNMPELRAYYGYPITIVGMLLVTLGMLVFFRRKGWLGGDQAVIANDETKEGE